MPHHLFLPFQETLFSWSQMGYLVSPVTAGEDRLAEIHAARERMTEEQRADPTWDL